MLSHDVRRPRDQSLISLYGSEPLKVSHHPTKCGGHGYCGSGDIKVLVCQVISQDHLMKLSCDFMDRSPSRQVTILQSLMAIATVVEDGSHNNFSLSRDFARVHDQKVM